MQAQIIVKYYERAIRTKRCMSNAKPVELMLHKSQNAFLTGERGAERLCHKGAERHSGGNYIDCILTAP
jgi:hypothetical protein